MCVLLKFQSSISMKFSNYQFLRLSQTNILLFLKQHILGIRIIAVGCERTTFFFFYDPVLNWHLFLLYSSILYQFYAILTLNALNIKAYLTFFRISDRHDFFFEIRLSKLHQKIPKQIYVKFHLSQLKSNVYELLVDEENNNETSVDNLTMALLFQFLQENHFFIQKQQHRHCQIFLKYLRQCSFNRKRTLSLKVIYIKFIFLINHSEFINKMIKTLLLALLIVFCTCRSYPLYSQCDSKWANDKVGTSSKTICQIGCLMSSASMALAGTGKSYNPGTLNKWLTSNGGYASGNLFVWASINKIGLTFQGFFSNSVIKAKLDAGYIVICNVHNGGHWVLATGYSGDNIKVNDPGYSTTSYPLSAIVQGNNGVYSINKMPGFLINWYYSVEDFLYKEFNWEKEQITSPEPEVDRNLIRSE